MGSKMDQWEQHFNDWVKLLETANAVDLMKDPQSIWDEAWRQAVMKCVIIIGHSDTSNKEDLIVKMNELLS